MTSNKGMVLSGALIIVSVMIHSGLTLQATQEEKTTMSSTKQYILTPKPPETPRINGAKVFGVRPGNPFLYTIPVTGKRPMTFAAENLPEGLEVNEKTGRITGKIEKKGEYVVTLSAENNLGKTTREFRIVCGDRICLTPPMGWNSWNCWARAVDSEKIQAAAKAMVESGLINHGWTYINIDDTWQGKRGGAFNAIQGNDKFPDMKALCDYVHGLGLKIGIYSTPWITSYALHIGGSSDNEDGSWSAEEDAHRTRLRHGKYSFAQNDAKQWSAWGIDYLKYDWNPNDIPHIKEMTEALKASGRDIIYSLSNSAPFENVEEYMLLANCWRTTGDIRDNWRSISRIGFSQNRWSEYGGPGHWNDPDMLVVGKVGWGPELHFTNLTPDEQYTHISLWCLLSSPLLLGCDLTELNDFTLSLLTNDEVLSVNQDPLGNQAVLVAKEDDSEVWAKDMEDGSKAVGLFNRGPSEASVTVRFSDIGLKSKQNVRDLWRQKNLGVFENRFEALVPSHGVVLVQIFPATGK